MNNDMEKKAFLFKNEKYEQGSNHPAYKGSVTINGEKWNLSFWLKQADGKGKLPKGTIFMAGEVDQYEAKQQQAPAQSAPMSLDDIPF